MSSSDVIPAELFTPAARERLLHHLAIAPISRRSAFAAMRLWEKQVGESFTMKEVERVLLSRAEGPHAH